MSAIMRLFRRRRPGFQARSGARDTLADARRIESIEAALVAVENDLRREHDGLAARLDRARVQASMLVGTDVYEYLDRGPEDAQHLSNAESQMARASTRLSRIEGLLAQLKEIRDSVRRLHG